MAKIKLKKGVPKEALLNKKVVRWKDDVKNPENKEFVGEVAFNKGTKNLKKVSQEEFNKRYGVTPDSTVTYKKK